MKHVYNFKMSVSDYRDVMISKTFGAQTWKRVGMAVIWVIAAAALVLHFTKVLPITSSTIYVCALLVTVILAAAALTMEVNIYRYREAYKNGFNADRQIKVDDTGFTFTNRASGESGHNGWEEISRIDETKEVFVIGLGAREAVILPKRAMGTQANIAQFCKEMEEKIGNRFHAVTKYGSVM